MAAVAAVHWATSRRAVFVVGFALLSISLLRTAWMSDDAYITLRSVDNFLNGYGPVWNTAERVQAFTHPMWFAVCAVALAVGRNAFYAIVTLSAGITFVTVWLLTTRVAKTRANVVVCFAALLSSKAFVDYSTSGLENPLTHLLVVLFVWQWWEGFGGAKGLQRLSLLAALLTLNRLDLLVLVAPAVAYAAWQVGPRAAIRQVAIGSLPLLAWVVFATFYYGTPFPNTAYAKLTTTITSDQRWGRGIDYLLRTLTSDPATLPVVAIAPLVVWWSRRFDWPLVAGMFAYVGYAITIGGDFMMGRFFAAPFVMGVALLSRTDFPLAERGAWIAAATVVVLGLVAPWEPAILSGYGYSFANNWIRGRQTREPLDRFRYSFSRSVMDERRLYSEFASLLKVRRNGIPEHEWSNAGLGLRSEGPRVLLYRFVGLAGYFAGPQVHLIDEYALTDPLLARIPGGDANSVTGHLLRTIPEGYVESVKAGQNRIEDADLAAYYQALHEITSGPLWSWHRLQTLGAFLSGRYDRYLAAYLEKQSRLHRSG